jgi:hypothetical protein
MYASLSLSLSHVHLLHWLEREKDGEGVINRERERGEREM